LCGAKAAQLPHKIKKPRQTMPPTHQEQQQHDQQQLEAPARHLRILLQQPWASQLLQEPPPGAVLTLEQSKLISASHVLLHGIVTAIHEQCRTEPAPGRLIGLLLRQQTALSAGSLVAWVQQRPEQLPFDLLQQRIDNLEQELASSTADVWLRGCECISGIIAALAKAIEAPQPGCSIAALAAATLQQLEQSGAA
jgi:hypothetical protein